MMVPTPKGPATPEPEHSLTIAFDDVAWAQLETLSHEMAQPNAVTVRRCVRLAAWIMNNLRDGYKIAVIKKDEPPQFVELL